MILVALVAWRFTVRPSTTAGPGGGPAAGGGRRAGGGTVEVSPVTRRTITNTLQSVGDVESPYKVEVAPKTTGRINFLQVREGDVVKTGQVLLKIDPSDLLGAVSQAQANVAEARSR